MRPAARLFYAQEKAELEDLLARRRRRSTRELGAVPAAPAGRPRAERRRRQGRAARPARPARPPAVRPPAAAARCRCRCSCRALPLQFIHEEDVGRALLQCIVGAGPPGAYNIAGDGVADRGRRRPRVRRRCPIRAAGRPGARRPRGRCSPAAVPAAGRRVGRGGRAGRRSWTPPRRREQLGWRPRYTGLEALRDTLRDRPSACQDGGAGAAPISASQARTSPASRSGHLQLRHVPDAGQLDVPPARVPPGDVAGGGDGHQPVDVARGPSAPAPAIDAIAAR